MGCEGTYVMDLGLAAVDIAEFIAQGGRDAIADTCGEDAAIEEVGEFFGEFAEGPMEPAVSSFLATEPVLNGVYTQGYCTTVVSAYEAAGRLESDDPVLFCQGYNSNYVLLAEGKARGVITTNSPAISIYALQVAYQVLTGEDVPRYNPYYLGIYATDTAHDIGVPYEQIEAGVNAFPDLPGGMTPSININNSPPNVPIWVQITIEDLEAAGQEF
jgi:ABC-type sugar transport system substrate-binding protein